MPVSAPAAPRAATYGPPAPSPAPTPGTPAPPPPTPRADTALTALVAHWRDDLPASLVVFLVALPLCLGIALASGAPMLSGIVSGVVGGIVVGALSGSPLMVSGPAAGLTAIVVTGIAQSGSFARFLPAVILGGVLQVALGALRAGIVSYYFPGAVIRGMLAAIGVTLILKQLPHAAGYDADFEGDFAFAQAGGENTFTAIGHALGQLQPGAIAVAVVGVLCMLVWPARRRRGRSRSRSASSRRSSRCSRSRRPTSSIRCAATGRPIASCSRRGSATCCRGSSAGSR